VSDRNRILIIEDDEGIRDGVRILFENEGYEVIEAGTGTDGLRLLDEQTDLLILDIMLPDISGFEVCEQVRRFSFVPILFLTAKAMDSDKINGFMAGGDDYLTFISEADLCNAPDGCEALLLCGMPAGTGPFLFVLPVAAQDVPSVPHSG